MNTLNDEIYDIRNGIQSFKTLLFEKQWPTKTDLKTIQNYFIS